MSLSAILEPRGAGKIPRMGYGHLRVYQAGVELRLEVDRLLAELPRYANRAVQNAAAHLNEAVDSICNNIAEGNDSQYPRKAANFFDIAACSNREARSSLEVFVQRGTFTRGRVYRAVGLTIVIDKMLVRMRQLS